VAPGPRWGGTRDQEGEGRRETRSTLHSDGHCFQDLSGELYSYPPPIYFYPPYGLDLPPRLKAREPRGRRRPEHTKIMRVPGVRARTRPALSILALRRATRVIYLIDATLHYYS
jgi:hypothetical protein